MFTFLVGTTTVSGNREEELKVVARTESAACWAQGSNRKRGRITITSSAPLPPGVLSFRRVGLLYAQHLDSTIFHIINDNFGNKTFLNDGRSIGSRGIVVDHVCLSVKEMFYTSRMKIFRKSFPFNTLRVKLAPPHTRKTPCPTTPLRSSARRGATSVIFVALEDLEARSVAFGPPSGCHAFYKTTDRALAENHLCALLPASVLMML